MCGSLRLSILFSVTGHLNSSPDIIRSSLISSSFGLCDKPLPPPTPTSYWIFSSVRWHLIAIISAKYCTYITQKVK